MRFLFSACDSWRDCWDSWKDFCVSLRDCLHSRYRHLVKPQAVPGDLELLLQHPEPSYPDLAVSNSLGELVDWARICEVYDACCPSSPLYSCLTLADGHQLHPPEPTLEWEDHHQMKGSPLTLRGESEKSGGRGRGKVRRVRYWL